MSPVPGEVAGLPEDGPAIVEDVAARLAVQVPLTEPETALLGDIVDAVNDLVRRLPVADRAVDEDEWPAAIRLGATQLALRLWRRRDSMDGVVQFAGDAPVYVQRNDPDVAQLLELGPYSGAAVG